MVSRVAWALVVAFLGLLIFMGCDPTAPKQAGDGFTEYRIVRIRACEYVKSYDWTNGTTGIAHAGDCDNPIHTGGK